MAFYIQWNLRDDFSTNDTSRIHQRTYVPQIKPIIIREVKIPPHVHHIPLPKMCMYVILALKMYYKNDRQEIPFCLMCNTFISEEDNYKGIYTSLHCISLIVIVWGNMIILISKCLSPAKLYVQTVIFIFFSSELKGYISCWIRDHSVLAS